MNLMKKQTNLEIAENSTHINEIAIKNKNTTLFLLMMMISFILSHSKFSSRLTVLACGSA